MLASVQDTHVCNLGGTQYRFRTPTIYDPARISRTLAKQMVRRPSATEFRVAAVAGLAELGRIAGEGVEAERQQAIVEDYYGLLKPTDENDIDEPDQKARAVKLGQMEADRLSKLASLRADIMAIEATLERHWPPYGELVADRNYWDSVSRIEIVRLLLTEIGGVRVQADAEGLMTPESYALIPPAHRTDLATFAFRLIAPDETQRKN